MAKTKSSKNLDLFDRCYSHAIIMWKVALVCMVSLVVIFPFFLFAKELTWAALAGVGVLLLIGLAAAFASNYLRHHLRIYASTDLPVYFPNSKLVKRFLSDRL